MSSSSLSNSMPECFRGSKMTQNSSVLRLPQIRVEVNIQWYKIVLHAQGPESKLFYGVFLIFAIQSQVFSVPPAMLSDDHPLGESLTTWPNKYHWLRWLMSPDKTTRLESHLLVQIAIPFKIPYLFPKCFLVPTEKYAFPTTTKIILIFLNFDCFEFSLYIFRESTSNSRLLYLILDYTIDNLK